MRHYLTRTGISSSRVYHFPTGTPSPRSDLNISSRKYPAYPAGRESLREPPHPSLSRFTTSADSARSTFRVLVYAARTSMGLLYSAGGGLSALAERPVDHIQRILVGHVKDSQRLIGLIPWQSWAENPYSRQPAFRSPSPSPPASLCFAYSAVPRGAREKTVDGYRTVRGWSPSCAERASGA